MKKIIGIILSLFISTTITAQNIQSPDGKLSLTFRLTENGKPTYQLKFSDQHVVKNSDLGIELKNQPDLNSGFEILKTETKLIDETWELVWGEVKQIRNHYRELLVTLLQRQPNERTIRIRFRLFNDGLVFRYEFPKQPSLGYFIVEKENTTFSMTGDHKMFWIPGDYDTNEYFYSHTRMSKVDATRGRSSHEIAARTVIAENAVQTPLMIKTDEGLYVNIHEAALVNYPSLHLMIDKANYILSAQLVPDAVGNKAYLQTPEKTPWRTIIISDKAEDILASKLILNLNEPCKIKDTSWIKPQKYIGIWWSLHVGIESWNYADVSNIKLESTYWSQLEPNGRHGATTENTKRYIDFAAEHGFDGVLVEGWNVGWEDWFGNWKEEVFDFVTPYPDFNVEELQQYAAGKGVKLIMHHETSSSVTNYERRMDEAYRFMKKHGYETVKTGYVGRIIPRGEYHDGQWMVNHFVRVAEKTAHYEIMINSHESVRPTGLHRTYPNWLACEAARGNEFNAWSSGNPPEHETILPFTRLMGGPMDYTPGIFQIKMDYYLPEKKTEQVHTTLVKQLALYVTLYSPLQMAADLPENYEKFMDAFQFIKDVPVDWGDTKILQAEPGDFIIMARKGKNMDDWFLGAITDEKSREFEISLDFLDPNIWYVETCYEDAPDADWKKNPMVYQIHKYLVNKETRFKLKLAEGGGAAIQFAPATDEQQNELEIYKN